MRIPPLPREDSTAHRRRARRKCRPPQNAGKAPSGKGSAFSVLLIRRIFASREEFCFALFAMEGRASARPQRSPIIGFTGRGKTRIFVIPRRVARRGISLFLHLNQREIPHFVRNDKINCFFRSLFSRRSRVWLRLRRAVLKAFEFPLSMQARKTFQHRGQGERGEKRRTHSLSVTRLEAANWSMIDETQPFWRLHRSGESRKLDAGRDFNWE